MEKVFTGLADSLAISPTTMLESMPPERNAPSGTSLIMRSRTASVSFSRNASEASSRLRRVFGS